MANYTSEHTGVEIDLAVENANLMLLTGAADPATSTVGTLGQIYQNTTDGTLFRCTNIAGETYTWTEWADYSLAEKTKVTNATTNIGTLASLSTTEKSNLVGAINEVDAHADAAIPTASIVNDLTTGGTAVPLSAEQGKELKTDIGNQTYTEDNYITDGESLTESVDALDMELKDANDRVGALASLTTTEKSSLVGAINEVDGHAEVNNISDTNATNLTDGGDSALHYHSADRDRTNHTGTQSADTLTNGTTNKVFTATEQTKLGAIAENANNYSHPTGDGNLHVPATSTTNNGKVLKAGATAGSIAWADDTDTITTINGKTGAIAKEDITALGIPAQDTVYTHPSTHSISEVSGLQDALNGKVDDSQVLTDVPENAKFTDTVYTHPSTAGNKHIPTGGTVGQILTNSASGTAVWGDQLSVVNGLAETVTGKVLDATQGKVLNELISTKKRTARFVVGTSTAGWTAADCDYLCDGTADQTGINAAITALPATGGEILILDGTYNITAKINVTKNNVSIRGNGNATILKRMFDSSIVEGVITLTVRSGCKIADLRVDGNNTIHTNGNNSGIYLAYSSNNTITSNTCNNNNYGIHLNTSSNNTITGNTYNNNNYGIYLGASSNSTVTGNTCNNNNYGIDLAYSSNNNTVTGNTCIRGTGQATDYTVSQHTIRLEGTDNDYNLISNNNCMGKAVTNGGGTGNTIFNNKYDASDDFNRHLVSTTDGQMHVPATSTTNDGKVLKAGATAGSIAWADDTDTITTINGKTGAIAKEDITALGIPAQDTVYEHPATHSADIITDGTTNKAFTATEQTKLGTIAENANNYVHPTTAGNKHIPTGGASGQVLKYSASGTAIWGDPDGGSIVDLGTFNDETELITHVLMNQLPAGQYTFFIYDTPLFMLLRKDSTSYNGTFHNSGAVFVYFRVSFYGEIQELKTIELRDLDELKADKTYVDSQDLKQMPISGGVLENYREKLVTLSGTSTAINLSLGNVFTHTLSGNTTYSITNAVSGQAHSFTLIINQTAAVRTLTFPASVKWQGGEIPDMTTASKTYILTFMTIDGGTNWLGMFGGEF